MGPLVVVEVAPALDQDPGLAQVPEPLPAQALVAQLAVERLDEPVFRRLSWSDEVERDAAAVGSFIQRSRCEFGAVIDRDRSRRTVPRNGTLEGLRDARSRHGLSHL